VHIVFGVREMRKTDRRQHTVWQQRILPMNGQVVVLDQGSVNETI